jgi:hypothetical protein
MRPLPCLLAAATLLAGCSRDVEVPEPTRAPRIDAFSPRSAYAGEWMTIAGSGFDPDPQGNLVQFARASARAESVGNGTIGLRVPGDAGSGQFTVTTRGGISSPSPTALDYRGLGELRARAVAGEEAILHKPYRVLALQGETFLHSDLLLGILRYRDPTFVAATAVSIDSAAWASAPSVVWLESSAGESSRLVRESAYGTQAFSNLGYSAGFGPIVAMRGDGGGLPDTVVVFQHELDPPYTTSVALHQLSDLTSLPGYYPYPALLTSTAFEHLRGCVDAGAGELACLVRERADPPTPLRLARISFVPSIAVAVLPHSPALAPLVAPGIPPDLPFCADPLSREVVAPLDDGSLLVLDLTTPGLAYTVGTGSRTPGRSLACIGGGRVLVSKRDDDLLTHLDFRTGRILWSADVPKASHADVDPTGATSVVHAVGEKDNFVRLLDLGTGTLLARRSFDVLPGRVEAPDALLDRTAIDGAGWYQKSGEDPNLAFATTAPRGVVEWPLTAKRELGVFPHFGQAPDALGAFSWIDRDGYVLLREQQFAPEWSVPLGGTAQLGVDAPTYVYFGTTAGLEAVSWSGAVHQVSAVPSAEFTSLGLVEEGGVRDAHVVAAVRSGGTWGVRMWTRDEAIGGSAAGQSWPSPGSGARMIAAAAILDGSLHAFYWDGGTLHAVDLDSDLVARSDTALEDSFYSIIAVSPNGRTFVSWDFQPFSRDTSVVIWSSDATAGFPRLATIPVPGQVSAAAFSGTGEQLYVVTRGPDRIVVLE